VRRLGRSGLRWKLVLALVATSAATLARAVAALVPPLEHRIAADRLDAMRRLAGTAALDLRRLPARDLRARSPRLAGIVLGLQRRTGATSRSSTPTAAALQDTDPEHADSRGESADRWPSPARPRERAPPGRPRDREAIVVTPVASHAGPVTLVLRKPLEDSRAAVGVMRGALPLAAAPA
jgi:hypothetical protein